MKTTFQTARMERRPTFCPCGQPAIKRDGASYVCADCVRRDQVANEIHAAMELEFRTARLTAEEFEAAREKNRTNEWFSRRGKRVTG